MNDAFTKKTQSEGSTILRVAKELRGFLADAPSDDTEARSLLRDCDTLDRVGHWLSTCNPITFQDGIDTAASKRKRSGSLSPPLPLKDSA